MKVILLRDVAKLGKRFSIIDTPDGYALNKLIPQGMAQMATPENVKRVQAHAAAKVAHASADASELKMALDYFAAAPLSIVAEANAQGHLFQAVKAATIAAATAAAGHPIAEAALHLDGQLKSVGAVSVTVKQGGVTGQLPVVIVAKS